MTTTILAHSMPSGRRPPHHRKPRDLFRSQMSSHAAEAFSSGLKGRLNEAHLKGDDHVLQDAHYPITRVVDGKLVADEVPALRAINSRLLDDYIVDCQGGVDRWNKVIEKSAIDFKFVQPHKGFNRKIGEFAGHRISPSGEMLTEEQWQAQSHAWLPDDDDMKFIGSLLKPGQERGKYAPWSRPPRVCVTNQPAGCPVVKID